MAPVRSFSNWNRRYPDDKEQVEPYRKYFLICEGANTEKWYFEALIDNRKVLGIHPMIDLIFLEKTDEDKDISYPQQLIAFAEEQKEKLGDAFDPERDRMIIVFDADIFEEKVTNYDAVVADGEKNNILAVSNPSFELFLLLHFQGALEEDILPNAEKIIQNPKVGNQRYIYKLLLARTGVNSKTNSNIGQLSVNLDIAIGQEKRINENIHDCKGKVTCNIGAVIESIRREEIVM